MLYVYSFFVQFSLFIFYYSFLFQNSPILIAYCFIFSFFQIVYGIPLNYYKMF